MPRLIGGHICPSRCSFVMFYTIFFSVGLGIFTATTASLWASYVGAGLSCGPETERVVRRDDLRTW